MSQISSLPPKLAAAVMELGLLGIPVDVVADPTMAERGYWRMKVGDTIMYQVNTPAALALLDGVVLGVAYQRKLMTIGDWASE